MPEQKIRLVLADDHQLVRKGFAALLQLLDFVELVGEASNGREVLEIFRRDGRADLVLLDYEMPVLNGLDTLAQLKREYFGVKVIILTMIQDKAVIQEAIEKDADGFLFKNTSVETLSEAIRRVMRGEKYFSGEVTLALVKPTSLTADQGFEQLTEREIEILRLVAQGFSSTEIGAQLYISPRTVDTHRNNLIQKLEVKGIAGLVQFALKNKLV